GAALLRHFADEFAEMPLMTPEKTGYGMGRKDLEQANCVRAVLGFSEGCGQETVFELACSVDDMTGERVGFAVESLFEAGALDAWWESIGMKKGRPGVKICALCRDEAREDVRRVMFRMTSTLGVRETEMRRCVLDRRTHELETALGRIRVKEAEGYGTVKRKFEYEDIARIAKARGLAPDEVAEMADKGLI
ncbi:MAG: LarC family nickel insertion protein, partial [Clostridia bacterium]|nr:LarC family nickel insertion protein [Clostridia bacterium]